MKHIHIFIYIYLYTEQTLGSRDLNYQLQLTDLYSKYFFLESIYLQKNLLDRKLAIFLKP